MKKAPRIAIAVSRFNEEITGNLLRHCVNTLTNGGVPLKNIKMVWVPGAYELPFICQKLAKTKTFDALIALGCVIKGETSHDQHVAGWAATGVGHVSLKYDIPIFFGVLTPNNEPQAKKRSSAGPLNRGKEVAQAALEMLKILKQKDF